MFFSNPPASTLEFLIFPTVNGTTENNLLDFFSPNDSIWCYCLQMIESEKQFLPLSRLFMRKLVFCACTQ